MKKKIGLLFSSIVMFCLIVCIGVNASAASGSFGDGVVWTYDADTGEAVISGTGVITAVSIEDYVADFPYDCNSIVIEAGVTGIGDKAFENFKELKGVAIPDTVTSIGDQAFSLCSNLTSIIIPDSVTSIGDMAFYGCFNLENVIVDADNEHYSSDSYGVLFNKDKSQLISYPTGNTAISYAIPNSVISINNDAFAFNTNLKEITIPDSVTSIGDGAFYYCEGLESITIPDSVTSVGQYTFGACPALETVEIGEGVTNIEFGTFIECSNLTTVTIPESVTVIGNGAFWDCINLTYVNYGGTKEDWNKISIHDGNDTLIDAYYNFSCTYHTDTDADGYCDDCNRTFIWDSGYCGAKGDNVTWKLYSTGELVISGTGDMADGKLFGLLHRANSIIVEYGVTGIGAEVFKDLTIKSVKIFDSVSRIGASAFEGCNNLASVCYEGTDKQWESINIIKSGNEPLLNATIRFLGGVESDAPDTTDAPEEPSTPDAPEEEKTPSFFEKVIEWFRDLFDKLFGWMKK